MSQTTDPEQPSPAPQTTMQPMAALRKPPWIRVRAPLDPEVLQLKSLLRRNNLHTVCEEASCPNLGECFAKGTATFLIMGDICTRRCRFCDVAHGRPKPLDPNEPDHLAETVALMRLRHVVITSVDRDDLPDGGASHFIKVIAAVRQRNPAVRVETLVPDFRRCLERALPVLLEEPPDVFNHNIETVPRLYKLARPAADYRHSLSLLARFGAACPAVPTKSGIMLGLGETLDEVSVVLQDLRAAGCSMVTIGQYLAPSRNHLPVSRYVTPQEFAELERQALALGFSSVASGPLVRSSYHAEHQAAALGSGAS